MIHVRLPQFLFQFFRCAQGFDLAVYHDGNPVAVFRLVHVVSGHEDRYPLLRSVIDQFPELATCGGVYTSRGFVEEYDMRVVEDADREGELLLPSQRQTGYKRVSVCREVQPMFSATVRSS